MTANRRGEKIGWIGGWLGGFVWVAILSVIFLVQHKCIQGISGLAVVGVAVACIVLFAPWRHPATPYWKLMIPLYILLFASVVWVIWAFGSAKDSGLTSWNLLLILPLLIPFGTVGRRKWSDANGQTGPLEPSD